MSLEERIPDQSGTEFAYLLQDLDPLKNCDPSNFTTDSGFDLVVSRHVRIPLNGWMLALVVAHPEALDILPRPLPRGPIDSSSGFTLLHLVATPCHTGLESRLQQAQLCRDIYREVPELLTMADNSTISLPLHCACVNGNIEAAQAMVDLGGAAVVGRPYKGNVTTLHLLCQAPGTQFSKEEPIVKLIDTMVALVPEMLTTVTDEMNKTCLHMAAGGGVITVTKHIFKLMVSSANPSLVVAPEVQGYVPLHFAVFSNHIEVCKFLCRVAPKMLKSYCLKNRSPLMMAACRGNVECLKIMLDIDPTLANDIDADGCTALYLCAQNNTMKCLEELLKVNKSNTRTPSHEGMFPIHIAASQSGRYEMYKALATADPLSVYLPDPCRQMSCLHFACWNGHVDVVEDILNRPDFDPELHLHRMDASGKSAMHQACSRGHLEAAVLLVAKDVTCATRPTAPSDNAQTPLHLTAALGAVKFSMFLLQKCAGVDVNAVDLLGNTALHAAVMNEGHIDIVRLLVVMKVDQTKKNKEGLTALDVATMKGREYIASFLTQEV